MQARASGRGTGRVRGPGDRQVVLVHWSQEEGILRSTILRKAGYAVRTLAPDAEGRKALSRNPPAAFVIDLSRLPSQGRDVALVLRSTKATRPVPIVFVEGEAAKVEGVRALLPDAAFTSWARIATALPAAIARPPASPVVSASNLAGYSGTPLPKKLGIKPGSTTVLLGAPEGFEQTLGRAPDGARFSRGVKGRGDLTLWFVRSHGELRRGIRRAAARAAAAPLWIAWRKKAAAPETDVGEKEVRATGLAAGLVDYKICAIDATWSGLLFRTRRNEGSR